MLQLPQDTGKLQEQLDDFKENIGLEELKLLNEASSKECSAGKLVAIGKQLKYNYSNKKSKCWRKSFVWWN